MAGSDRGSVRFSWIVVAGLGAAFTMMIKPHYALVFLFPYLLAAFSARALRVLWSPEVMVAALATVAQRDRADVDLPRIPGRKSSR